MRKRFSPSGEAAIYWAESIAAQLGHSYVGSGHLLLGLSQTEDPNLRRLFAEEGLSPALLLEELQLCCGRGTFGYPPLQGLSPQARSCILGAAREAQRSGHKQMEPLHLLLGLLRVPDSTAGVMLEALGTDQNRLFTRALETARKPKQGGGEMTKLLDRFSVDLTERAAEGRCTPVIGPGGQARRGQNRPGGKAGHGDRRGSGPRAPAGQAGGGVVYVLPGGGHQVPGRV